MQSNIVGRVIEDRYRIDALIARGGMGVVYRATQLAVGRTVALKVLGDGRGGGRSHARFEREARALAGLSHPHIVSLIDYGVDAEGRAFIVMEHLEGEQLASVIAREAPLSEGRVHAIAIQLLRALVAAHAAGIVHRDLKPSNVIVVRYEGTDDVVKVLDFGIATSLTKRANLTGSRDLLGSPRYISPEQAARQPVTDATDLYALGCVLYELLTGRAVFPDAESPLDCVLAHAQEAPEPPRVAGVALESPIAMWAMRCLAKAPWQRPASAAAMLAALTAERAPPATRHDHSVGALQTGPAPAERHGPPPPVRPRRRPGVMASIGVAAALAFGAVQLIVEPSDDDATPEREPMTWSSPLASPGAAPATAEPEPAPPTRLGASIRALPHDAAGDIPSAADVPRARPAPSTASPRATDDHAEDAAGAEPVDRSTAAAAEGTAPAPADAEDIGHARSAPATDEGEPATARRTEADHEPPARASASPDYEFLPIDLDAP